MADSEVHRVFLDRRRGETSSPCTCCVHRQGKRNHRGLLPTAKREIWIKKKGMDILDFSPLPSPHYYWNSRILRVFEGEEGRKNIMFARFSFPPVFNIFENFLAPLYFLTFIIPLIFIAEPSYFLSFHFKKDYVSLFFYLFFFFCLYIIWSSKHLLYFSRKKIFFGPGRNWEKNV